MNTTVLRTLWSIASVVALLSLLGCSSMSGRSVPTGGAVGTVLGGGLGAVACNDIGRGQDRTAAMIGCGLVGAAAGSLIGSSMDELQTRRQQPGHRPPPPPPSNSYGYSYPPSGYSYPTPYAAPAPSGYPPPGSSTAPTYQTYPSPYSSYPSYPPAPSYSPHPYSSQSYGSGTYRSTAPATPYMVY